MAVDGLGHMAVDDVILAVVTVLVLDSMTVGIGMSMAIGNINDGTSLLDGSAAALGASKAMVVDDGTCGNDHA